MAQFTDPDARPRAASILVVDNEGGRFRRACFNTPSWDGVVKHALRCGSQRRSGNGGNRCNFSSSLDLGTIRSYGCIGANAPGFRYSLHSRDGMNRATGTRPPRGSVGNGPAFANETYEARIAGHPIYGANHGSSIGVRGSVWVRGSLLVTVTALLRIMNEAIRDPVG